MNRMSKRSCTRSYLNSVALRCATVAGWRRAGAPRTRAGLSKPFVLELCAFESAVSSHLALKAFGAAFEQRRIRAADKRLDKFPARQNSAFEGYSLISIHCFLLSTCSLTWNTVHCEGLPGSGAPPCIRASSSLQTMDSVRQGKQGTEREAGDLDLRRRRGHRQPAGLYCLLLGRTGFPKH
jgi:hypothetical protein